MQNGHLEQDGRCFCICWEAETNYFALVGKVKTLPSDEFEI